MCCTGSALVRQLFPPGHTVLDGHYVADGAVLVERSTLVHRHAERAIIVALGIVELPVPDAIDLDPFGYPSPVTPKVGIVIICGKMSHLR